MQGAFLGAAISGNTVMRGLSGAAAALAMSAVAVPASAQRAEENVNTQSDDAFGRAVGNDRSGLYNPFDVRGFNPSEAGNVRMQGLYFDLIELISARLIHGSTIRVGLAAQRYPFPGADGPGRLQSGTAAGTGLAHCRGRYSRFANRRAGGAMSISACRFRGGGLALPAALPGVRGCAARAAGTISAPMPD